MLLLSTIVAEAQIVIGGKVYGGARQADVGGSTFVNIGADYCDVLINAVYGGNDISGEIGTSQTVPEKLLEADDNHVDNTYNAFIRTNPEGTGKKMFIGSLFGGGNGDYTYTSDGEGTYTVTTGTGENIKTLATKANQPILEKSYLEIAGGTFAYVYGGGNNVTVSNTAKICIDNNSTVTTSIMGGVDGTTNLLADPATLERMEISILGAGGEDVLSRDKYQFSRVFGGNNKADMEIRPSWNLKKGKIDNLYSGGNMGAMTHPNGIWLNITSDDIEINNVYGGCRMADVNPAKNEIHAEIIDGVSIPEGYSARTSIWGGNINNVYGGNDISGTVYGGNVVGIHSTINGDVYGGGNGSYPYTDNPELATSLTYRDYYYNPDVVLANESEIPTDPGLKSLAALNLFRPNAEAVSIHLTGAANRKVIVRGSIYCGGNSATLRSSRSSAKAELKIGSYVLADKVFLGSNGENMVTEDMLKQLANYVDDDGVVTTVSTDHDFSKIDLTNAAQMEMYMKGCELGVRPFIGFDEDYVPYSTYFGSFYCGGNVGSVRVAAAASSIDFTHPVVIFDKFVGGCNNAYVKKTQYNAAFEGGILKDASNFSLSFNLSGLKLQPMRWPIEGIDDNAMLPNGHLVWNTVKKTHDPSGNYIQVAWNDSTWDGDALHSTMNRRLDGGNIYGGCYESGHVEGDITININSSIVDLEGEHAVFDQVNITNDDPEKIMYNNDENYEIVTARSGVILDEQGMDPLGSALNLFGGGYGRDSEIWGSVTINLKKGYVFQIFGGGELGAVGKGTRNPLTGELEYDLANGYDPKYSTYINLHGGSVGKSKKVSDENMAECEFIYGGGFEGLILGDTHINLGNGRVFNTFAGSCNADILGHTETYIGQWQNGETTVTGFPWIRDHVYGGNDLGGRILGSKDFISRVRSEVLGKVYNTDLATATTYIEYTQGRVENIFGGCYGDYDYTDSDYENRVEHTLYSENAFVNIRPIAYHDNSIKKVFGAGQGSVGSLTGNEMQDYSYVLIDIPDDIENFKATEVFGAGSCNGLGMRYTQSQTYNPGFDLDKASAVIDLARGQISAVYGASYESGVTRRTVVNVPVGSTIALSGIFGGAYGTTNEEPCDVYEAIVNYSSPDALVSNIYGGNNAFRRTLYATINVSSTVMSDRVKNYQGTVYGAGLGEHTWAQYTEVNLKNGALVDQAYGGGMLGKVISKPSVIAWKDYMEAQAAAHEADPVNNPAPEFATLPLDLGNGYVDNGLNDALAKGNRLHSVVPSRPEKYNTNVRIYQGATVGRYCYGGGLGDDKVEGSGDVYGTTYAELLGGKVTRDLYAAGTTGAVYDRNGGLTDDFGNPFIASANVYVEGGSARNVYGGGWKGSVGKHEGSISDTTVGDIAGETHVYIGKKDGGSFFNGLPAIERNAYGGGEGGAVFGTANLTFYNGFIGYRRFDSEPTDDIEYIQVGTDYYQEKLHDETWSGDGTNRLYDSGCIFGGGYIDNSNVDITNVKMYGGHVRNAVFGGGEIAAIGRGIIILSGQDNSVRNLKGIYKAGKTNVEIYEGHVHRNVFGGGRGYNNLGEGGTLYSDGFVFGQTVVKIHGGEVGTAESVDEVMGGYGNVFGGGDIGYVYSAYEKNGALCVGQKFPNSARYDDAMEGYYYRKEGGSYNSNGQYGGSWYTDGGEYLLTEDCKVVVEPYCKVLSAVTINGHAYSVGDYVQTSDLNTLGNKNLDSRWASLDSRGITIYNAVFAGGNTSSGSSTVYANTTTVFGNASASIHDVYHRDLITLGTGHTGGLYGDGNLTFVDGYRELNITNYGTDYYTIDPEITIDIYRTLPQRERAYYELKYKCVKECVDTDGTQYHTDANGAKASTLTADDLIALFEGVTDNGVPIIITNDKGEKVPNPIYWEENGVCSIYAGRLMNTIQRSDFCGVFGSRMVMKGAQDRVPEVVDYTNYTINRVREVSLNQQRSVIPADIEHKPGADPNSEEPEDYLDVSKAIHGNYFGIYNVVNYLGALTSDVHFRPNEDTRITDNSDTETYGPEKDEHGNLVGDDLTYYNWKKKHVKERKRNNGTSFNKVALASGVYLELTSEKSTGTELNEKDWGYVTGVIELDLINVQTGIGGGFVYAKNEHGRQTYTPKNHNTLTELNADAITRKDYTYSTTELYEWQTSGNFVHGTQTIIDDCYNISGRYSGDGAVPAHYWFIKGSVYVYDRYISAYTGSPNAYSERINIPLTITASSNAHMKLLNVMPNRYAYFSQPDVPIEDGKKIVINDVSYYKNDPISYWDWYLLSKAERALFVEDTYVTIAACKVGDTDYPEGSVLLPEDYETLKASAPKKRLNGTESPLEPSAYHTELQKDVAFDYIFRSSNNVGHDTGYMLTYSMSNPRPWDTWYTKVESANHERLSSEDYNNETGYESGPTYHLKGTEGGILGQRGYNIDNVISKETYDTYQSMITSHSSDVPDGQAEFEPAYIVTEQVEYNDGGDVHHLNVGTAIPASLVPTLPAGSASPAYICLGTIQLEATEYIYVNTKMTAEQKAEYISMYQTESPLLADEIDNSIVPAYICTTAGLYGGNYYEVGKNYRGLEVWSSMSKTDRERFDFNYDAFDLLIDPLYSRDEAGNVVYAEGRKYQYDGADFTTAAQVEANGVGYSLSQYVDYSATYQGTETLNYGGQTITNGTEVSRTVFESIPNEKRFYSPISVQAAGNVYVVHTAFEIGNSPYAAGTTITANAYNSLGTSEQSNISVLTFTSEQVGKTYYYCRESYVVGEHGEGVAVTKAAVEGSTGSASYTNGQTVPLGFVIEASNYSNLTNKQMNFLIHGISPNGTGTLYVARNSDIFDLSKEKIITVIYEYNYEESDATAMHITPISERHVVNFHRQFKSGVPTVENIKSPRMVIPGDYVGLREPNVIPGAYEVTGGGWKIFEKISDAENHTNGIDYIPRVDKLYWYNDGYYVAYYAKTYLGETYSNHVPLRVANYHDLDAVMKDKAHHMYVDNPGVKRESKIYIDNRTCESDPTKSELDLLKDFFDLSVLSTTPEAGTALEGHANLDTHVHSARNLEFILRSDVSPKAYSVDGGSVTGWTPIGYDNSLEDTGKCFEGTLHGDGHTITGLDHSLFGHLCGEVYNLGVTGSYTSAGIADEGSGYLENCWINTSDNTEKNKKALFENPINTANRTVHLVNCYYPQENQYLSGSGSIEKPLHAFRNGEVTYDLNGFYLFKRYCDNNSSVNTNPYQYYTVGANKTLTLHTGYYANATGPYLFYDNADNYLGSYVESRFADGDYQYAGGEVPSDLDERYDEEHEAYHPIWPDDYFFFGQALNYNHVNGRTHQDNPTVINRSGNYLVTTDAGNRVFRAPAYYRSGNAGVAYFNPYAVFAQTMYGDESMIAYKDMTAIDFTGGNGDLAAGYKMGNVAASGKLPARFYPPLLDDGGLSAFVNVDLTKNLLVYTGVPGGTGTGQTPNASQKTANVVSAYLADGTYTETNTTYRTVDFMDPSHIRGHWVQQSGGVYTAVRDHFLVDLQDFNAPIAYNFGSGNRMWYQRYPDHFVNMNSGWESVSLPFEVELVTTDKKGELTHFYKNSTKGHEYWLREFKGNVQQKMENNQPVDGVFTADFDPLAPSNHTKNYTNTFLYDYYYSQYEFLDRNTDEFKKIYYSTDYLAARYPVDNYPYYDAGKPYIVGFPGKTFFEFDLSGTWTPDNLVNFPITIASPGKQYITFASVEGTSIGVSDNEMEGVSSGGYTFVPTYLNNPEAASVSVFALDNDGGSFENTTAGAASLTAFRPYIKAPSSTKARKIILNKSSGEIDLEPTGEDIDDGSLIVYSENDKIVVKSTLRRTMPIRIYTADGARVATFKIHTDETFEVPVSAKGVYLVNNKKLIIH